jgi:maltose alpha-D-glucosyltransferase / alpha-amylase
MTALKLPYHPTLAASFKLTESLVNTLESSLLAPYFNRCRWFAGKARSQDQFRLKVSFEVPLLGGASLAYMLIVEVSYHDGAPERYLLPLAFVNHSDVPEKGIIATAQLHQETGFLIDAIYDQRFRDALFAGLSQEQVLDQANGQLRFVKGKGLEPSDVGTAISNSVLPVDSSNSAMIFGDKYFLKLYRKLFQETNPEVDMVAFITEDAGFQYIPAFAGSIAWQQTAAPDVTLGMMQRAISNQQDAWVVTGDYLNDFLYGVPNRLFAIKEDVFEQVALLGKRTGEMHIALYAPEAEEAFAPERFTNWTAVISCSLTTTPNLMLLPRSWLGCLWRPKR